jgi:NAD(P)-dependent dehydrogenase (short-subunit alcohol dehydrogenase family)
MSAPRDAAPRSPAPALAGKVALVLGASRGIGAATARALARAGASVALAARDARALDEVAAEVRALGAQALPVRTEATDAAALEALVRETVSRLGRLDVAFNNAGASHPRVPLAELPLDEIDRSIALNFRGLFVAMKLEVAAMLAAGGGGAIVNMSSTAGVSGVAGLSAYSATKHALVGATRSVALEYAAKGIRVNAVAPGPIVNDRIAALGDAARAQIARAVPMARIGLADEVAAAVVWLCSDAAAFITGAVVPVDGGRLAGSM